LKSKTNWKRQESSRATIDRCILDVKPPLTDCVSFLNVNLEYFRESSTRSLHDLHESTPWWFRCGVQATTSSWTRGNRRALCRDLGKLFACPIERNGCKLSGLTSTVSKWIVRTCRACRKPWRTSEAGSTGWPPDETLTLASTSCQRLWIHRRGQFTVHEISFLMA
jgi:hypothetical protein